jgi:integrase
VQLQEIGITATFREERYSQNGSPLRIDIKAAGPTLHSAIFHGLDAIFERKDIRQKRPGLIEFHVRTEYSGQALLADAPKTDSLSSPIIKKHTRFQRGSLTLRGKRSKVWVGRWREDAIVDGRSKRIHRTVVLGTLEEYPNKSLARRALDLRVQKTNSFGYRPCSVITLEALAEKWKELILPHLKPSSQVAFRAHLKKWILPRFGSLYLHEIGGEQVQEFISGLPVSPKTVRNVIGTFRVLWKAARSWQYIDHNCFDGIRFPRAKPGIPRCFSLDDMRRIIAGAEGPYRTLYWIVAETGMRASELCGLTVDDIDLNHGSLQIRQSAWRGKLQTPKTANAIRVCRLSDDLAEHLKEQISGWKPNDLRLLFATRTGTPIDQTNVVRFNLQPLLKKLGIQRAGFHAFRHGNSSVMDQLNTPLRVRQDRLGHADPTFTMKHYTHSFTEDHRSLVARLGASLNPNKV